MDKGNDLTLDYPVKGYNRVSREGKRYPVQPHERGAKKAEILAKIRLLQLAKKNKEQFIEIDIWIDKGFKDKFEKELWKQDVKDVEFSKIDEDRVGIRYSITFRTFSKTKIPEGRNWQLKNEFELNSDMKLFPIVSNVISQTIIPVIKREDSIALSEFREIKTDFETKDFVMFHGPIARDGPYVYETEKGKITLQKDIGNLSDIYSKYDYLPIKASEKVGAHYAEELGYGTNFSLNKETNEIEADLILVNDDQFKEILKNKDNYHVSPGYSDIVKNGIQIITDLDHIALALGNEISRACTGTNEKGSSCTTVKQLQSKSIMEVV